ncbi:MAG: type II toxin-antitoxin system VapB family antitoxin [Dehalococcoidia bacterium]|nr:type II toxin-antitoxin system VapB family antitoxin [Dehalococcoidia bacterium]
MRTTIDVDERLMGQVEAITGEASKNKAVNKALQEYVRRVRIEELLASLGKLDLDLDDWYEFRHMER